MIALFPVISGLIQVIMVKWGTESQHIHRRDPCRTILLQLACRLGIPLRGVDLSLHYRGDFYGQTSYGDPCPTAISVDRLITVLQSVSSGTTELGCHPGLDGNLNSMYRAERATE